MIEVNLSVCEEYSAERFVRKTVHQGEQCVTAMLHLLPGQEVPTHPHAGLEIILLPQKGEAVLTIDGSQDVALSPGMFYYEGDGHTFRIQNRGKTPFQMLATMVRIAPVST